MQTQLDHAVVALPIETVRVLTVTGAAPSGEHVHALRAAGHAGGEALGDAFDRYVAAQYGTQAGDLPVEVFAARMGDFFGRAGWGAVGLQPLHDVVAAVDVTDSWEARAGRASAIPGCHITTGALSAFFGRFAGYAIAALEVECASAGQSRCRFLLGPPDVLEAVYGGLASGQRYEDSLTQLSGASASA